MVGIKNGIMYDVIVGTTYRAIILTEDGRITAVYNMEKDIDIIEGLMTDDTLEWIDAEGLYVYPGLVDAHSHLGLDGYAIGFESKDYNEMNDILTPQLRAIAAIYPQDETFALAREGGVTCVATGPGSSNVLGGMFAAIKTAGHRIDDMIVKFPVAMKCAFGENPKRCYKDKNNYRRCAL